MTAPTILWLRQDLRLADQPALAAAIHDGPVIPVYLLDDETPKHRRMGAASRWWLHHSLAAFDQSLREKGSRLILRRGKCDEELARVAAEVGAGTVHADALTASPRLAENNQALTSQDHLLDVMQIEPATDEWLT